MKNEKGICVKCKKERVIFYNKMCQGCYKNNNYSNKYKKHIRCNLYHGNNELIKSILKEWCKDKISAKEVYKYLNKKGIKVSYQYCCRVIKTYGIESESE